MRRFALLALLGSTSSAFAGNYTAPAVDSVSLNPNVPNTVLRDNRVRADNNPVTPVAADINGVLKFDVSMVPDCETITAMVLSIQLEQVANNPFNTPFLRVNYSTDDNWTRSTATSASAPITQAVTARILGIPGGGAVMQIQIDLTQYDFQADLADDFITLVLDNENLTNSHAWFLGPYGTPSTTTIPELTITTNDAIQIMGTACNDRSGQPLNLRAAGCPTLGSSFVLGLETPGGAFGLTFFFAGLSNTNYFGIPLPFDLGVIGAPGCSVQVSQELMLGGYPNVNPAVLNLYVPTLPYLVGATTYWQAALFDPQVNALQFAFSQHAVVTVQ